MLQQVKLLRQIQLHNFGNWDGGQDFNAEGREFHWLARRGPKSMRDFGGISRCSPSEFLVTRPFVIRAIASISAFRPENFRKKVRSLYGSCWGTVSSSVSGTSGMEEHFSTAHNSFERTTPSLFF